MLFWITVAVAEESSAACPKPEACLVVSTDRAATWALVDALGTVLETVEGQQEVRIDPDLVKVVSVAADGQRGCRQLEGDKEPFKLQMVTPELITRTVRWNNGRLANDALVTVQCGPYVVERLPVVDGEFQANATRDEEVVVGARGAIARWRHGMPVLADPGPVVEAIGGGPVQGVVNAAYPGHPAGEEGRVPLGPDRVTQLRFADGTVFSIPTDEVKGDTIQVPVGVVRVEVPEQVSWTLVPEVRPERWSGPTLSQGPRPAERIHAGAYHFVARHEDAVQHARVEVESTTTTVAWSSPAHGLHWTGRIVGADGKPEVEQSVWALCDPAMFGAVELKTPVCRTQTDANGEFDIATTEGSPWTMLFHPRGSWLTSTTQGRVYRLVDKEPAPLKGTLDAEGFLLADARWVLQAGDLLVAVDGVPTTAMSSLPADQLEAFMGGVVAGAQKLTVRRGGELRTLDL